MARSGICGLALALALGWSWVARAAPPTEDADEPSDAGAPIPDQPPTAAPVPAPVLREPPPAPPAAVVQPSVAADPWRYPPPAGVFDQPRAPAQAPERHWYGGETLMVDAASLGLLIAGISSEEGSLALIGGVGYVLGGPIVHGAHGHAGKAFGSAGLRLGLPVAGAFLGVAAEDCSSGSDFCGLGGAVIGLGVGALAAIIFDAAFIANEDGAVESASSRVTVAPTVFLTHERAGAGLLGSF